MPEDQQTTRAGFPPDPAYREAYPWHADNWGALTRRLERLPHALLLHGQEGLGKRAFALRLAHTLLCADPGADAAACGRCPGCRLFVAGTHPDLIITAPIEDSAVITVDQVRVLAEFLNLRPHTAARKLVIVNPAQALNQNAANALLKLLEEPPADSVFLMLTPHLARLPATIRSRCSAVAFLPPERSRALAWIAGHARAQIDERLLDLAGGAPLLALSLAADGSLSGRDQVGRDLEQLRAGTEDPLRCAARWKAFGADPSLRWAQGYVAERVRARLVKTSEINIYETKQLFDFFDVISQARDLAHGPLDETLLLEGILIQWCRLGKNDRLH